MILMTGILVTGILMTSVSDPRARVGMLVGAVELRRVKTQRRKEWIRRDF